jgi:hypothetical protein
LQYFVLFLGIPMDTPDKTDESPTGQKMHDFDYDSIDEIDDADDDSLHVLIKDKVTGEFGWHWVYRDELTERGLFAMGRHAMPEPEDA